MNKEKELIWAMNCVYAKNSVISAHSHDFYHYFYTKNGDGKIRIGANWYDLKRGRIHLMPPSVIHEIHAGESGLCAYEIKFRINNDSPGLASLPSELCSDSDAVERAFEFIFNEIRGERAYKEEMLDLKLSELLLLILRSAESPKGIRGPHFSEKFGKVLFYIDQHISEDISLQLLADVAHLEKIYFLKQFKAEMNITPMAYLRNLRISEAKKLLLLSDMNVTQISSAVGFPDVHHFSSCFKKCVGVSPKEYKEKAH